MNPDCEALLYNLFADLLAYPTSPLAQPAEQCPAQLPEIYPDAASALARFYRTIEKLTLEQMQELYTVTFDMQPVCYPYVGYQLFGESYKRGAFMAQLNEAYHTCGYSIGHELPDHLPATLRFLALDTDAHGDFCQVLRKEGLVPAVEKMLKTFGEQSENPYFGLLSALHLFLVHAPEKELDHA